MKRLLLLVLTVIVVAAARFAPTGMITGTVTDATGSVVGATVAVRGTTFSAITNDQGRYMIRSVPAGNYTVEVSRIGYATAAQAVTVVDDNTVTADFSLTASAVLLEGLVVSSASRRVEKITDAPATVNVITQNTIAEYPSNIGELAARQIGVDYVRAGVAGPGLNIRGFNSAFNPKNLQMNDGRLSTLIATGLPFGQLSTVVKDDIERVEIVLGPTAALYGPNAHNGLINTLSRDPRTSEGTTLAIGGGSQEVINARFRHARALSERFAFKVAGEYYRGTDYEFVDTVYIGSGAAANPQPELELDRDFNSLHGEASAYFTVMPGSDLILTYGGNQSSFLGPTNAGRNQIQDWRIHLLQVRWTSPRLFAQVYHTWSNTDSTYAINQRTQNYFTFKAAGFSEEESRQRSFLEQWSGPRATGRALPRGALFIDDSRRWNGEVQFNDTWAGFRVTAGAQVQRDIADSRGTYLIQQLGNTACNYTAGSNPDCTAIELDQWGAYGQVERPVTDKLRFVVAARGDDHELYGFNFIPKGGLLYSLAQGTARVTYGKGIAAPTILNLSARIFGGLVLGNGEGFTLSDGTTFDPLEVETIQTFEAGWKGILRGRLYLDAGGYYNMSENFLSPLIQIAPRALTGGPRVTQRGSEPIANFQGGVLSPGDFLLTYVNFGEVDTYGLDLGLNYYLNSQLSLSGTYSYFDFSLDKNDPKNDGDRNGTVTETDLPINTPKHKATLGLNASQDRFFGSIFGRWVQDYDFFSGINVASKTIPGLIYGGSPVVEGARVGRDFNEGPLGGFNVDLTAGMRVRPNVSVAAHVTNLFDSDVREFVAAPATGRLVSTELRVTF
jgi:iron complex outermembrane receptor protein